MGRRGDDCVRGWGEVRGVRPRCSRVSLPPCIFSRSRLSLLLFRTPMDLYAMFGLFMLIGIVKKNGILQVDKTNELRRGGMARDVAILEANHTRLRPILMTTLAALLGAVPLVIASGPGKLESAVPGG